MFYQDWLNQHLVSKSGVVVVVT